MGPSDRAVGTLPWTTQAVAVSDLGPSTSPAKKKLVRRQYGAQLVVINIGDTFTTGPKEAAFVINELIQLSSAIASHANELAIEDGKAIAGTKTGTFMEAIQAPVHLLLSGRTMEFDAAGTCVAGC